MTVRIENSPWQNGARLPRRRRINFKHETRRRDVGAAGNDAWLGHAGLVAQQFDMRESPLRRKRRHFDTGIAQAIETRLLGPLVKRTHRDPKAETFIKRDAAFAVGYTDRGMVNAKTELRVGLSPPTGRHLAVRERSQLKRMTVRIAEFKRGDASR